MMLSISISSAYALGITLFVLTTLHALLDVAFASIKGDIASLILPTILLSILLAITSNHYTPVPHPPIPGYLDTRSALNLNRPARYLLADWVIQVVTYGGLIFLAFRFIDIVEPHLDILTCTALIGKFVLLPVLRQLSRVLLGKRVIGGITWVLCRLPEPILLIIIAHFHNPSLWFICLVKITDAFFALWRAKLAVQQYLQHRDYHPAAAEYERHVQLSASNERHSTTAVFAPPPPFPSLPFTSADHSRDTLRTPNHPIRDVLRDFQPLAGPSKISSVSNLEPTRSSRRVTFHPEVTVTYQAYPPRCTPRSLRSQSVVLIREPISVATAACTTVSERARAIGASPATVSAHIAQSSFAPVSPPFLAAAIPCATPTAPIRQPAPAPPIASIPVAVQAPSTPVSHRDDSVVCTRWEWLKANDNRYRLSPGQPAQQAAWVSVHSVLAPTTASLPVPAAPALPPTPAFAAATASVDPHVPTLALAPALPPAPAFTLLSQLGLHTSPPAPAWAAPGPIIVVQSGPAPIIPVSNIQFFPSQTLSPAQELSSWPASPMDVSDTPVPLFFELGERDDDSAEWTRWEWLKASDNRYHLGHGQPAHQAVWVSSRSVSMEIDHEASVGPMPAAKEITVPASSALSCNTSYYDDSSPCVVDPPQPPAYVSPPPLYRDSAAEKASRLLHELERRESRLAWLESALDEPPEYTTLDASADELAGLMGKVLVFPSNENFAGSTRKLHLFPGGRIMHRVRGIVHQVRNSKSKNDFQARHLCAKDAFEIRSPADMVRDAKGEQKRKKLLTRAAERVGKSGLAVSPAALKHGLRRAGLLFRRSEATSPSTMAPTYSAPMPAIATASVGFPAAPFAPSPTTPAAAVFLPTGPAPMMMHPSIEICPPAPASRPTQLPSIVEDDEPSQVVAHQPQVTPPLTTGFTFQTSGALPSLSTLAKAAEVELEVKYQQLGEFVRNDIDMVYMEDQMMGNTGANERRRKRIEAEYRRHTTGKKGSVPVPLQTRRNRFRAKYDD